MSDFKKKLDYLHDDMSERIKNIKEQMNIYKELDRDINFLKKRASRDASAQAQYNKISKVMNKELKPLKEKFSICVDQLQCNLASLESNFILDNDAGMGLYTKKSKRITKNRLYI